MNDLDLVVLTIAGCPHLAPALHDLRVALDSLGLHDEEIQVFVVDSPDQAMALEFRGSPTFVAGGADLFPEEGKPTGLSCRLYRTPSGLKGSPGAERLAERLGDRHTR